MNLPNDMKKTLARHAVKLMSSFLPSHGKRAIFLTTLFMEVAKISPSHAQLLDELNDKFDIVKDTNALKLPAKLHDLIWDGHHLNIRKGKVLTEEEITGMSKRIIREMSQWSQYSDDEEEVLNETRKVIEASLNREGTIVAHTS